jgi:hypothetical protein
MMSSDAPTTAHEGGHLATVRVERNTRGKWSVAMPDSGDAVMCETLDDARHIAHLFAARTSPCELIVHDAYHRVLHRELIQGPQDPEPSSPTTATAQPATAVGQ